MTEDLIAMAAKAGFPDCQPENHPFCPSGDLREAHEEFLATLERFAALIEARAVARTREECASLCEQTYASRQAAGNTNGFYAIMACTDAIRALGERT